MKKRIATLLLVCIVTTHISVYSMSDEERSQALEEARNACDPSNKESRDQYDAIFREIFRDFFDQQDPYRLNYPDDNDNN